MMTGEFPFHPRLEDLPPLLPVFPLPGAMLLPWGRLPLNIFEPRYLAMVEDCLAVGRLIGMIQPRLPEASALLPEPLLPEPVLPEAPPLYQTGCAGRVSSFSETADGRLLITLTGVCRFRVLEERSPRRGYRIASVDWLPYAADLQPLATPLAFDHNRLLDSVCQFLRQRDMPVALKVMEEMRDNDLVTALSMLCPFEVQEKQALLEAATPQQRVEMLMALLEMAICDHPGDPRSCQ